jgi:hypothetical protein
VLTGLAEVVPAEPVRDREDEHEGGRRGGDADPDAAERGVARRLHVLVEIVVEPRGLFERRELVLVLRGELRVVRLGGRARRLAVAWSLMVRSRLVIGEHRFVLAWAPARSGKNKHRGHPHPVTPRGSRDLARRWP